ncbi:hypothetical protein Misp06_00663 [Microbulbifer sp. NBRC 101763]
MGFALRPYINQQVVCSGLLNPDTNLGGKVATENRGVQ